MKTSRRKKLTLKADPEKDIASFFAFVADAEYDGGRNIEWAIVRKYPNLRKWFEKAEFVGRREEVVKFVSARYKKEKEAIEKNLSQYELKWREIEPAYDELVRNLFGDYPWPEGKYIGYATLWGIFPRFLEDKTFQVPYRFKNRKYVNVIIAHELLHFIFYAYFHEKYPRYQDDEYDEFSWHVSEIFNGVIQDSESWKKVFGLPSVVDPAHREVVSQLSKIHAGSPCWDLDNLIQDIIKAVERITN